ncbi:MAG: acylneuraminate cytidylyltransferase [Saprospiraceae bacterium]|nr:MAG: acylneuraminate cytidylyltransferase [Saprospiraceae bacterium]
MLSIVAIVLLAVSVTFTACRNDAGTQSKTEEATEAPATEEPAAPAEETPAATSGTADTTQQQAQ